MGFNEQINQSQHVRSIIPHHHQNQLERITIDQNDEIRRVVTKLRSNYNQCQIEIVNIKDIMYLIKMNEQFQKPQNSDILKMVDKVQLLMSNNNIDS